MRSFIVSILLLLVILGCWVGFDMYSNSRLDSYIDSIEAEIMPHIESENWQNAAASLEMLEKDWHEYRKYAEFFLGTTDLNEISYTITKSKSYIENADAAGAAGELSYLKSQISFLDLNEKVSAGNIF